MPYLKPIMKIRPGDTIGYQGTGFLVEQVLTYALADRSFNLVRMKSPDGQIRFLEIQPRDVLDRIAAKATSWRSLAVPP